MFCKLCTKYNKVAKNASGKWVTVGCIAFRHDRVLAHGKSSMHRDAERARLEEHQAASTGGIQAAFQESFSREKRAVIGALKCIYFLTKHEIPHTTNFSGLLDLAISLGCDYLRELRRGANATYRSEQAIAEFVECISSVIQENILKRLHLSESISIMIDESTDVSVLKQLVIYSRGVVGGTLECHFLGIRDLSDGRAATIETAVLEFLEEKDFDIANVSSLGSDGAAVMTGRKDGVATRLRRLNSNLISIHCVAHRLALAAGQASQSVPYLRRFKEILSSLFYFYHNSSVRQAGLTQIQTVLGDVALRLKQAKDVRWLSHQSAVDALRRSLIPVLTSLDREAAERGEPTASGLVNFMRKYFFVAALSLFADVLPHLCKLSKVMQKSSLDYSLLHPVIQCCIQSIEKQIEKPEKYFSEVDDLLESLADAGHQIVVSEKAKSDFVSQVKEPYLSALVQNLHDRFPAVELISSFGIFNPSQLPENDLEKDLYGTAELDVLLDHYSSGPLAVDRCAAQEEWKELKSFITNAGLEKETVKGLCTFLLSTPERQQLFPVLSKLLVRGLLLPIATADCERSFSAMNRIKTTPRNRLKTSTLEQLMIISIEGPPEEEFDFSAAAEKWASYRNRRLRID